MLRTCRHCGTDKPAADFTPNPKMRDGLSSWCSECHNAATRRWRAEHRDEINARRRIPRDQWKPRKPRRPSVASDRVCVDCGLHMMAKPGRTTCLDCSAKRKRDRTRRKNSKRRGARYQTNYTLEQIAERDGCRCHICRRKVDMRLSGMDPKGPTIDHLIPVSDRDNTSDDPRNVALAHRSCNCARGDGGEVQLRWAA